MIKILLTLVIFTYGFTINAQYCLTGGPSSPNDSNLSSLIFNGTSGGINYTGCPGVLGVEEFFSQTTTVDAGSAYSMTIEFGTCGGNYASNAAVWIDFNQNNLFEPSEEVITWGGTPPMIPGNYVVNIPASSLSGITRMRVMHAESLSPPLDPCASFTWGSVTDFLVEIENGVDCSGYIGDDSSDPRIVASLPFTEVHDNSFCYSNQNPAYNSPDVYYQVVPGALTTINASLCGSTYDTYISVQDKYGVVIAFNDDNTNCGGTQSEINIATAGFDTIYVIVEGWGSEMGEYTINIGEGVLGMTEMSNDPFVIYPNPASGSFKLEGGYVGEVQIMNTEGKIVLSKDVNKHDEIDVSALSTGFYIVRLKSESRIFDKKLIIE